jgi:uncharacterized OB-fold protein
MKEIEMLRERLRALDAERDRLERAIDVLDEDNEAARKCSNCGDIGHDKRTCPNRRRCSNCGKPGHDRRTCEE